MKNKIKILTAIGTIVVLNLSFFLSIGTDTLASEKEQVTINLTAGIGDTVANSDPQKILCRKGDYSEESIIAIIDETKEKEKQASLEVIEALSTSASEEEAFKEEYRLLANIIYREARGEPYECKVAVAKTVFNRINSPLFPNSLEEVLSAKGQFDSYGFDFVDDETLDSSDCYNAIKDALNNVCAFSEDMLYFKANGYFYGLTDYICIGNTYFSIQGL